MSEEKEHPNARNVDKFTNRIGNLIDVTADAEELSVAEIIGAMEIVQLDLYMKAREEEDGDV